jgi:hypothetical protein
MEFRWIIFLVLWTVIAGPIFARPSPQGAFAQRPVAPESTRKP